MTRRLLAAVAALILTFIASTTAALATPARPQYYLALGDSLSKGYMPPGGDSDQGYVDFLYAGLKAANPSLQLVKLGCSGETTATMLEGGVCSYGGAASQQAAAQAFLRSHPGQVKYVTLDIGANDVDKCAPAGAVDVNCAVNGLVTVAGNTFKILSGLRAAGGFTPTLVGMTYYDPFLAAWLKGADGQTTAQLANTLLAAMNFTQAVQYKLFGGRVADVSAAFKSGDFTDMTTLPGFGSVPVNVATICALTYMCTVQNIHPNVAGYRLIAATFATTLGVQSTV